MTSVTSIKRWRVHPVFARALPFALYIGFLAAAPLLHGLPDYDDRWLYGVQIGTVMLALALCWRHYAELHAEPRLSAVQWALAGAAGVAVFVLWINLDTPWASTGGGGGYNPSGTDGALDLRLVTLRLFGAALVVPVMEELFWRSLVMRWIEARDFLATAPAAAGLRALCLSSLVFGLEHSLWLAGILAGLAYGELYRRSGRLWVPVVAHAVTNLLLGLWVVATGNWQFW